MSFCTFGANYYFFEFMKEEIFQYSFHWMNWSYNQIVGKLERATMTITLVFIEEPFDDLSSGCPSRDFNRIVWRELIVARCMSQARFPLCRNCATQHISRIKRLKLQNVPQALKNTFIRQTSSALYTVFRVRKCDRFYRRSEYQDFVQQ